MYSIAAASIIAKEYHDEHIREICTDEMNERYGLLNNMGYLFEHFLVKHRQTHTDIVGSTTRAGLIFNCFVSCFLFD